MAVDDGGAVGSPMAMYVCMYSVVPYLLTYKTAMYSSGMDRPRRWGHAGTYTPAHNGTVMASPTHTLVNKN
jgi:hypothetical protein